MLLLFQLIFFHHSFILFCSFARRFTVYIWFFSTLFFRLMVQIYWCHYFSLVRLYFYVLCFIFVFRIEFIGFSLFCARFFSNLLKPPNYVEWYRKTSDTNQVYTFIFKNILRNFLSILVEIHCLLLLSLLRIFILYASYLTNVCDICGRKFYSLCFTYTLYYLFVVPKIVAKV